MANKRIDELSLTPGVSSTDLLEKERDPGGSKFHEKVSVATLISFIQTFLGLSSPFATTADLLANTNHVNNSIYLVLGDANVDDGISRLYRYSSTDDQAALGLEILIPNDVVRPVTGSYIKLTL